MRVAVPAEGDGRRARLPANFAQQSQKRAGNSSKVGQCPVSPTSVQHPAFGAAGSPEGGAGLLPTRASPRGGWSLQPVSPGVTMFHYAETEQPAASRGEGGGDAATDGDDPGALGEAPPPVLMGKFTSRFPRDSAGNLETRRMGPARPLACGRRNGQRPQPSLESIAEVDGTEESVFV
jgi:hypothetical protein